MFLQKQLYLQLIYDNVAYNDFSFQEQSNIFTKTAVPATYLRY